MPIVDAFVPVLTMEHAAIIGGFQCLYWLLKHEVAHHTKYPALLDLGKMLGCDYFSKLKVLFKFMNIYFPYWLLLNRNKKPYETFNTDNLF